MKRSTQASVMGDRVTGRCGHLLEGAELGVSACQQLVDLSRGVHAAANIACPLGHERLEHLHSLLVRALVVEHARLPCTNDSFQHSGARLRRDQQKSKLPWAITQLDDMGHNAPLPTKEKHPAWQQRQEVVLGTVLLRNSKSILCFQYEKAAMQLGPNSCGVMLRTLWFPCEKRGMSRC